MAALHETVANGLAAYYQYVAEHLHKWVDPLTNEQFWRKPYPYGNSVGHLVLHLTGNLSYYLGRRVAETIQTQREEDWGQAYAGEREPEAKNRFQIFVRCAGHAYHHVGQIIYLSRELERT